MSSSSLSDSASRASVNNIEMASNDSSISSIKRKHETLDSKGKRERKRNNSSNDYEVEKIVEHRWSEKNNRMEYCIKWKGYPHSANTWEGEANLAGCSKMLNDYHSAQLKSKMTPTTVLTVPAMGPKGSKTDQIDDAFIQDFGGKLLSKMWNFKKVGRGRYEIVYSGGAARSSSPAPSVSEVENGSRSEKESTSKRLQAWIKKVNEICARTGEVKLLVENQVDDAVISFEDFKYVTSLVPASGINIPTENLIGCSCKGGGCSRKTKCCATGMNAEFAYLSDGRLRLQPGRPIYECNSKCACDDTCYNRVVQKGRQVQLCIFRTDDGRGWGVKAVSDIAKNTFVVEYVGEVISKEEADARPDNSYMFNMDFDESPILYVVDAKRCGNVARFINHSCEPNLGVFGVWIDHYIGKLPRLAFFANRDIKADEELTFHYFSGNSNQNDSMLQGDDSDDETLTTAALKTKRTSRAICKCGSDFCRKYAFDDKKGTK